MSSSYKSFILISFLALAAFVAVGFSTVSERDWPFADGRSFRDVANLSGPLGSLVAHTSFTLVGRLFAWLLPLTLITIGVGVIIGRPRPMSHLLVKTSVLVVLLNAFFSLIPFTAGSTLVTGAVGSGIGRFFSSFLGVIGSTILVITSLLLVLLTEARYAGNMGSRVWQRLPSPRPLAAKFASGLQQLKGGLAEQRQRLAERANEERYDDSDGYEEPIVAEPKPKPVVREPVATPMPESGTPWLEPLATEAPKTASARVVPVGPPVTAKRDTPAARVADGTPLQKAILPPLSILTSRGQVTSSFSSDQLRSWSNVLEAKLADYGVRGSVTAVNQGPLVTTFEFEPAAGVKIKDIVSRSDDLALAMRARSLRLIAPIPGRAVVGIEIPNPEQSSVYLYDVISEIPERVRYSGIMIAVGVDAVGKPFHMNLCTAPHLLMAGTTGAGKSVSLNCFLASILFQYRPSDVQLLLIDPKMVEMSIYNGIPHLLHPVITDPRDAVRVFNFLIGEMVRRNRLLHRHAVKNIQSFNSKIDMGKMPEDSEEEKLPYIVLVVDELADLVLTKGADFESLLSRLSNMARAVGIHMIVATQRPSVDIIDGKTKANFATRIAFRVATKVDSRTILDCMGAEKLLGRGDMLYVDAKHPEALRLHGAWMSEEELEQLVDHWKQYEFDESQLQLVEEATTQLAENDRDSYFHDARNIVIQYKQGSTSLLQRRLHVGYARAARLLDQLEQAGIVGPPDGSKPRELLVTEGQEEADKLS